YKGKKPVLWSPSSESALAEAEIEYKDKRSPSTDITYDVIDSKGLLDECTKLIIWTTTTWTSPASLAVNLLHDIEYEVIAVNGEKYVVANDLVESLEEELKWENPKVVQSFMGREADNIIASHTFYDRDIVVMNGLHVTIDAGTGCVHTAPG